MVTGRLFADRPGGGWLRFFSDAGINGGTNGRCDSICHVYLAERRINQRTTAVKIAGANLGTTVTFGGIPVQGSFFEGNPTMYLSARAHAAGTVDVVVSGQGGQLVRLIDGYTYVSRLTFDFNGDWASYGENDQDGLIFLHHSG